MISESKVYSIIVSHFFVNKSTKNSSLITHFSSILFCHFWSQFRHILDSSSATQTAVCKLQTVVWVAQTAIPKSQTAVCRSQTLVYITQTAFSMSISGVSKLEMPVWKSQSRVCSIQTADMNIQTPVIIDYFAILDIIMNLYLQ